ncbi:TetR/AcrR family transcriptional regulator [Ilumatobacter sp.]|uniref:TetR/AcrR family transcriptional regulator n=1 Tax=Ilumatobacter sp. TaxID=1967498 RepID=UPI003C54F0EF
MSTARSTGSRQRNARGEGDRLRVDLLDAAAELMAEHGTIDGISLRAVARRAGVSPTAVYRHFDDHLALLRESVAQCWRNFYDVMVEARDSSSDPYVAFDAAGTAYVRFAMEHQGQYRVLFSNRIQLDMSDLEVPNSIEPSVGDLDAGFSAFQILVQLVTAILDHRSDDRDPYFVAIQVHTWIHGMVDIVGCHPDERWPAMDTMLNGLSTALDLERA